MRRFMMLRKVDETGVSGVGHIADGVVFEDGTVVVRWRTKTPGTTTFASIDHAKAVHGHDGKTTFEFHDWEGPTEWLCCMCFSDMDLPVNHCFECGAGGAAVAMSKEQLLAIQRHDKYRLERHDELTRELKALRRVAVDVYGPAALGLTLRRNESADPPMRWASVARGNTSWGSFTDDSAESDEALLLRVAEGASLDPDHVRRVHAEALRRAR